MKYTKKIILCIVTLIFIFNITVYLKYDLNILQYVKYSLPLTDEEENWLEMNNGIVYGADKKAYPLSFYNSETKQVEGVLADYFSYISIEYGIKVTPVALDWEDVLISLEDGSIMTSDLFVSDEREKNFDFTYPIYNLSASAVMLNNDKNRQEIKSVNDLRERKVAVVKSDYSEEFLINELGWNEDKIIKCENIEEAMYELEERKAEAVIGDETVLEEFYIGSENVGKYYTLENPVYTKEVRFAVKKDNDILKTILNKGILKLKKDNIIKKTQSKWYSDAQPIVKDSEKYNIILYSAIAIIGVFVFINFWNYNLRKKVREKTRELELSRNNIKKIMDVVDFGILVVDKEGIVLEKNHWCDDFANIKYKENIKNIEKIQTLLDKYIATQKDTINIDDRYFEFNIANIEYESTDDKLIVIKDITQKKIDEICIRQQSKMVAIGHLVAGLTHEIRNPLGLIKSYLFVIRQNTTNDIVKQMVEKCDESVIRINNLITTLLNISGNKNDIKIISTKEIADEIIMIEEKQAKRLNVKINYYCNNILLKCEIESLKVIIINLIDNALEALANEEVNEKFVVVNIDNENDILKIKIGDNGEEIDAKIKEYMFNPFFTTKDTGTGLGLYLVNNEVEKMGGNIVLEYKNDMNVFTVSIPNIIAEKEILND